MPTSIALIRGINVGGQKSVPMEKLRKLFVSLGFKEIQTYIQSGNVVFEAKSAPPLEEQIAKGIKTTFGFEVTVIVRTPQELAAIAKANPFKGKEENRVLVTFLQSKPATVPTREIEKAKSASEQVKFLGKEVFLHCPDGYGKSKLSNTFLENKLKVAATTRNMRTVTTLLEMVKG